MTGLARRLLGKKTCLCTAGKRDSMYDEVSLTWKKCNQRSSPAQYGLARTDKPRRLIRQAGIDESDGEDDISITERLRRASSQSPANIPMLVVVSFHPNGKGLLKRQIEIQRGFPVNAQYIENEWLFIRTADSDEGFVPYVCCRPMLRRQPMKPVSKMEHSYQPHDFQANELRQIRSPPAAFIPTLIPPTNEKYALPTPMPSQSYLNRNFSSFRKRPDVTSSSCGGDSGVSDCESSSHNHRSSDFSVQGPVRSSNLRTLRSSSNTLRRTGLTVQDVPLRQSTSSNQTPSSRCQDFQRFKSQLLVSRNSAFTQIVKANSRQEGPRRQPLSPHARSSHREQDAPSTSLKSQFSRLYDSYDETTHLTSPSSKRLIDDGSSISSPSIRRTPFVRRSLPHHLHPILKKTSYSQSFSSPESSKKNTESQVRHIVLAEPSFPAASLPFKSTMEKHFSDLSLNQIENDSLTVSTPLSLRDTLPRLSCSSASSASTSSASRSSTDDSNAPFIHVQMTPCRLERKPLLCTSAANSHTPSTKSTSFIHNVSITV